MVNINEKGSGNFRADFLSLSNITNETIYPASNTTSGALKVSGAKLYISDSSAWNLVTSA